MNGGPGSLSPFHEVQSQKTASSNVEKLGNFRLQADELEISDGVQRVYIDEYKDLGDGKVYKGEWNKKTGERDGLGV